MTDDLGFGSPIWKRMAQPTKEYHPRFCQMMSDVAAGRKTVDEAWKEWVEYCEENGIEPVNR